MNSSAKSNNEAKLPGLNGDLSCYIVREFGGNKFREIPFADWLPPDFSDVLVTIKGSHELHIAWYSPARNLMIIEVGGRAREFNIDDLDYWLKKVL